MTVGCPALLPQKKRTPLIEILPVSVGTVDPVLPEVGTVLPPTGAGDVVVSVGKTTSAAAWAGARLKRLLTNTAAIAPARPKRREKEEEKEAVWNVIVVSLGSELRTTLCEC